MSYLDLPRIHFGGQFQASPSTINNTPNNFDPSRWPGESDPDSPTEKIELYWAPQGNGIFDLVDCSVTAVVTDGSADGDPLSGKPVSAVYTKAPPKLVDLDPMQQNVSEVWGLMLQIGDPGGAFVRGTFEPVAFNSIWQNSQGPRTPRSSASGGAVYQSTLTNLVWQNPDNQDHSEVLETLRGLAEKSVSKQYPDPRLSARMVVNTHNNNPHTYQFDRAHSGAMTAAGVPQSVVDELQALWSFRMMEEDTPGLVPTSSYVNFLLKRLLGEQVANEYGDKILEVTKQPYVTAPYQTPKGEQPQPYDTIMPTRFNYGLLVGTLGPAGADEPRYMVPARTLAPPPGSPCYFAPAKLRQNALTLDLGNSLPVELPGRPPWGEKLGTLSVKCGSDFSHDIDYGGDLLTKYAGVLDIELEPAQAQAIGSSPLSLAGTPSGTSAVLLEENSKGLSLRADQFVFRMNPGKETTPSFPRGNTARVDIRVRKFGEVEGVEGLEVALTLLDESAAIQYTKNTLGTSGTKGLENLSVPQDALGFDTRTAKVGPDGVVSFQLTASDPGNPRGYVDGQVYFVRYGLTESVPDYVGDFNDLVSVQIYQHTENANPTWDNGIGELLTQFGRLFPVMATFGLSDHDSVKKNHVMIRSVLELDISQPLHMPVTRDLSESRRQLIFDWMDKGMP